VYTVAAKLLCGRSPKPRIHSAPVQNMAAMLITISALHIGSTGSSSVATEIVMRTRSSYIRSAAWNTALLTLLGAGSSLAAARHYDDDISYARVTRVEPIYETTSYAYPRQQCWNESAPLRSAEPRSNTAPILGAIIGGALGNALGHHHTNKVIGTVAGAALGAAVGRDISYRDDGYERVSYGSERVCETVADRGYREEVVAYRVYYRYHGHDFVREMDYDPGPQLKVHVNVEPDD
jgi:uncharacterized protein YcfJ